MSTDASADAVDNLPAVTDYDEMLDTIDIAIEEAKHKIQSGRIRDPDREKVRVKQWKALGYLVNIRRQVANDRDLEQLADRIDAIEASQEKTPDR